MAQARRLVSSALQAIQLQLTQLRQLGAHSPQLQLPSRLWLRLESMCPVYAPVHLPLAQHPPPLRLQYHNSGLPQLRVTRPSALVLMSLVGAVRPSPTRQWFPAASR